MVPALVRADDADSGEVCDSVCDWLRRVFEEVGPIPESVVRGRFVDDLVNQSRASLALVLEDVHRRALMPRWSRIEISTRGGR